MPSCFLSCSRFLRFLLIFFCFLTFFLFFSFFFSFFHQLFLLVCFKALEHPTVLHVAIIALLVQLVLFIVIQVSLVVFCLIDGQLSSLGLKMLPLVLEANGHSPNLRRDLARCDVLIQYFIDVGILNIRWLHIQTV